MTTPNRSLQLGFNALLKTSQRPENAALIKRLVPIAQELARGRTDGITVADLRLEAQRRGIALPEKPHFLGSVMKAAELVSTGDMRRSTINESHGNVHVVWRLA